MTIIFGKHFYFVQHPVMLLIWVIILLLFHLLLCVCVNMPFVGPVHHATDLKLGSSTYFFLLYSFLVLTKCQVSNLRVGRSRDQVPQRAHLQCIQLSNIPVVLKSRNSKHPLLLMVWCCQDWLASWQLCKLVV